MDHFKTNDYEMLTAEEKDGLAAYVQLTTGKPFRLTEGERCEDYFWVVELASAFYATSTMTAYGYKVIPFEELKRMASLGLTI